MKCPRGRSHQPITNHQSSLIEPFRRGSSSSPIALRDGSCPVALVGTHRGGASSSNMQSMAQIGPVTIKVKASAQRGGLDEPA